MFSHEEGFLILILSRIVVGFQSFFEIKALRLISYFSFLTKNIYCGITILRK